MSSTEWSSCLKIISDITSLGLGVEAEVVLFSLLSLNLAVDVLKIINTERFSLLGVEVLGSLGLNFLHSSLGVSHSLLMALVMQHSQHLIVVIIDVKLHWVLVVSEESIVSIGQIGKSATLKDAKVKNK